MLRPSSITATLEAMLSQLENQDESSSAAATPFTHTALVSILESAQIYACASNHSKLIHKKRQLKCKEESHRQAEQSTSTAKGKEREREREREKEKEKEKETQSTTNSTLRHAKNLLSPSLSPKSSFFTNSIPSTRSSNNQSTPSKDAGYGSTSSHSNPTILPGTKPPKPKVESKNQLLFGKGLMVPHSNDANQSNPTQLSKRGQSKSNSNSNSPSSSSKSKVHLTGEERNQCLAAIATMAWRDEMNRVQKALNTRKEIGINQSLNLTNAVGDGGKGKERQQSRDRNNEASSDLDSNSNQAGNSTSNSRLRNQPSNGMPSTDENDLEMDRLTKSSRRNISLSSNRTSSNDDPDSKSHPPVVQDELELDVEGDLGKVGDHQDEDEDEQAMRPWIVPAGMKIGRKDSESGGRNEEEVVPLLLECDLGLVLILPLLSSKRSSSQPIAAPSNNPSRSQTSSAPTSIPNSPSLDQSGWSNQQAEFTSKNGEEGRRRENNPSNQNNKNGSVNSSGMEKSVSSISSNSSSDNKGHSKPSSTNLSGQHHKDSSFNTSFSRDSSGDLDDRHSAYNTHLMTPHMLLVLNSSSSEEELADLRNSGSTNEDGLDELELRRRDEECWSRMYVLARSCSKHLSPSLATCGLGGFGDWEHQV